MDIGWKIISVSSMALAGLAAAKVVDLGWKAVTGHQPPEDAADPSVRLAEVVVFAVVSGAMMEVARQLALTGAARWYNSPPQIES